VARFAPDLAVHGLPGSARRAWQAFRGEQDAIPRYTAFHERFAAVAREHPRRPAVADETGVLTYAELDRVSGALAATLAGQGARPGAMVGVADYRDRETAAAVLAVVKAGGVLVPLNPRDPADRLGVVAADCGLAAVLGSAAFAADGQLDALGVPVIRVRLDDGGTGDRADAAVHHSAGGDLAYVIYTSGSTGKPKGVKIRHDSLSNLVDWMLTSYPIGPEDVVAVMSALYFDPAAQQVFPAWAAGSCLVLVPPELMLEPLELVEWLARRKVTHLDLVTAHWAGIISAVEQAGRRYELPSLRWLLVGGESMHYEQAARWHAALPGPAVVVNLYGPTEATVNASEYVVDDGETMGRVPIGSPLPHYRLHVVDEEGRLCPPYAVGELLIGGIGVAEGYTDPVRTELAFPHDPTSARPGARLYRTGDAARLVRGSRGQWVLEFLGRRDGQVKIGGNRIELEEIEAVLQRSPELSHAAVVVAGDAAAKSLLCLYVTRENDTGSLEARLRERLAAALPGYMVPHRYRRVPHLEYKSSGKLDREGLAQRYGAWPPATAPGQAGEALRGAAAEAVAEVWSTVLGRAGFTAADDYFALGGTSLLALEVVAALKRRYRIALRVAELYRNSTFGALCALVEARTGAGPPAADSPQPAGGHRTAAKAEPAWAADLDEALRLLPVRLGAPEPRTLPTAAVCSGEPVDPEQDGFTTIHLRITSYDVEAVCAAVGEVIAAHPLLRSTVDFSAEPPVYRVHAPATVSVVAIESTRAKAAAVRSALCAAAVRSWPSATQSPVRAAVQLVAGDVHLLLWISHSVCDGESQSILIGDLETALRHGTRGDPDAGVRDRSPAYTSYLNALSQLVDDGAAPEDDGFAGFFAEQNAAATARLRERLARAQPNLSERTLASWRRPTEAMSAVLCAFADVLALPALPVLVDYHGRAEKEAMDVIGGLATRVPALVRTADGLEAAEQSLCGELSVLGRRHADQMRAKRGAPAPTFLRINMFEQLEATDAAQLTVLEQPGNAAVYGEHMDVTVAWRPEGAVVTLSGPYDLSPVWRALASAAAEEPGA
jgi:amino acid adenylation domain-containing protein